MSCLQGNNDPYYKIKPKKNPLYKKSGNSIIISLRRTTHIQAVLCHGRCGKAISSLQSNIYAPTYFLSVSASCIVERELESIDSPRNLSLLRSPISFSACLSTSCSFCTTIMAFDGGGGLASVSNTLKYAYGPQPTRQNQMKTPHDLVTTNEIAATRTRLVGSSVEKNE